MSKNIKEVTEDVYEDLHGWIKRERVKGYISTGLKDLDDLIFGYEKGQVIVVGSRPSIELSDVAIACMRSIFTDKYRQKKEEIENILYVSYNFPAEVLVQKMIGSIARVNMRRVAHGFASEDDQRALAEALINLKTRPIIIDDEINTFTHLKNRIYKCHEENPLSLVFIDYLQVINSENYKLPRDQQLAEMSRDIKKLARDIEVPVIVFSSLNRECERENRPPKMYDLRDSGSLEDDADVVILLSRIKKKNDEEDYFSDEEEILVNVSKNNNGATGEFEILSSRSLSTLSDMNPIYT
jgi:replicative DNA helicase